MTNYTQFLLDTYFFPYVLIKAYFRNGHQVTVRKFFDSRIHFIYAFSDTAENKNKDLPSLACHLHYSIKFEASLSRKCY